MQSSLSESCVITYCQHPDGYFLTFQLGFGSFLGIIGAHLIENKRQMVRGFLLPLCTHITPTSPPVSPLSPHQAAHVVNATIELQGLGGGYGGVQASVRGFKWEASGNRNGV